MKREFNPVDIVIGFGLGIAATLIVLRLAGIVENDVSIWGQFLIVPTMLLVIARQIAQRPNVKRTGIDSGETHCG